MQCVIPSIIILICWTQIPIFGKDNCYSINIDMYLTSYICLYHSLKVLNWHQHYHKILADACFAQSTTLILDLLYNFVSHVSQTKRPCHKSQGRLMKGYCTISTKCSVTRHGQKNWLF
jgi:hypothetical protein